LKYHKKFEGKLQILPKCSIRDHNDFSYWYTPGVTKPSCVISKDKDQSFNLTNRWNSIAIVTDGTKVGPFNSIPEGESIHCLESARGELCFHMISDGSNKPYRAKIRGSTFDPILVLLPDILKGRNIADAPVIYWSLDNCPADHDR
jgi:NADH:ubiquinone oxidoreductase subunit D